MSRSFNKPKGNYPWAVVNDRTGAHESAHKTRALALATAITRTRRDGASRTIQPR